MRSKPSKLREAGAQRIASFRFAAAQRLTCHLNCSFSPLTAAKTLSKSGSSWNQVGGNEDRDSCKRARARPDNTQCYLLDAMKRQKQIDSLSG